jgi:hypothetical protein
VFRRPSRKALPLKIEKIAEIVDEMEECGGAHTAL